MRKDRGSLGRVSLVAVSLALLPAALSCSGSSSGNPQSALTVTRGGPAQTSQFTAATSGEVLLTVTAAAPGVSWQQPGAEAAVVSLSVDGRYETDLVVPSANQTQRPLALGQVPAGKHTEVVPEFVELRWRPMLLRLR